MRQTIGTTWIFQLVIVFMLVFVAFLSLSLNYTKAFKIKNELISTIEKFEGLTQSASDRQPGSIQIINNYLMYNNYSSVGTCDISDYGAPSLQSTSLEEAIPGKKYYYCVRKIDRSNKSLANRAKYEIKIFFKFSLPVIGDLFTFSSEGTTIDITYSVNDINYYTGN